MDRKVHVRIQPLHSQSRLPKRATQFSGGWDVAAAEIWQEAPDFVIVKLGFALEIPHGYKLTLVPRSSLTHTKWIVQNSPGLGDADYRGEYQFRFRALPEGVEYGKLVYPEFPYHVGERIGQVYLEEVIDMDFEIVRDLSETVRGEGGFGHTGY